MRIIWDSELRNCILYIFIQSCGVSLFEVQSILQQVPPASKLFFIEHSGDVFPITDKLSINAGTPFRSACLSGKLDIMQFLWESSDDDYRTKLRETQFSSCYIFAVKNGYFDIIRQLTLWVEEDNKAAFLSTNDFSGFIYAADQGHLEII